MRMPHSPLTRLICCQAPGPCSPGAGCEDHDESGVGQRRPGIEYGYAWWTGNADFLSSTRLDASVFGRKMDFL